MATIVVSDVHIGYKESKTKEFISFLEHFDDKELILLGDIFDFWRKANATVLLKSDRVFELLSTIPKVTYVVGNHDYTLINYAERYNHDYGLSVLKYYKTTIGGKKYYMDHGYVLDVVGNMEPMGIDEYEAFASGMCNAGEMGGFIASSFYGAYEKINDIFHRNDKYYANKVTNALAKSKSSSAVLGKTYDEYYIYGHTHQALMDSRRANTGCWIEGSPCTFVLIENRIEDLVEWCK